MLTLYTAIGRLKIKRDEKGNSVPAVINNRQEYSLSEHELVLWSCLAFQILQIYELEKAYRFLGKLHIQPVADRFRVRLFTCIQLYLERKIKIRDFRRYLKKEKCDPMEETVLELAKATELTTAELLACVEQRAKAKNPKEVWDLLYEDTDATYESLADEAQLLHIQYPVLQAIGNLYLNKQISFQQF